MKRKDITTLDVLQACFEFGEGCSLNPFRALKQKFNAPDKVVYAAMYREEKRDNINYGVSIRVAFLTETGYNKFLELKNR